MKNPRLTPDLNEEYEIVEETPWPMRHPGATMSLLAMAVSAMSWGAAAWHTEQSAPEFEKIHVALDKLNRNDRHLGTFQMESSRHTDAVLAAIARSANVEMPMRDKELDRAEARVRDIVDGGT